MSTPSISTALLISLTLPSLSRAQPCANQARMSALETGYYNASGTVELSWPQAFSSNNADAPWHLSLHVNDTRSHINQGIAPTGWDISMPQPYLSVDRSVRDVSVCVFQFAGRNATATGDGADGSKGCAGVLSDRCTEYMRGKLENTTSSAGRCELPWEKNEEGLRERVEACGEEFNPSTTFASPRIDVSQSNCSLPLPPGARNLSTIGREYNTFWVRGEYKGGGASPFQDVDWTLRVNDTFTYDLVVTQPVPMLVVASFAKAQPGNPSIIDGLRVEAQMACVTPGDIVAGSRLPGGGVKEEEEGGGEGTGQGGDESAAVRVRVGGLPSVIVVGVVTLMLVR